MIEFDLEVNDSWIVAPHMKIVVCSYSKNHGGDPSGTDCVSEEEIDYQIDRMIKNLEKCRKKAHKIYREDRMRDK